MEWFILSELQECSSKEQYLDKKKRLYRFMQREFIDHEAIKYCVFLLLEIRRDERTGILYFTDKVEQRPTQSRPKQRGTFKLYLNDKFRAGDDLKL